MVYQLDEIKFSCYIFLYFFLHVFQNVDNPVKPKSLIHSQKNLLLFNDGELWGKKMEPLIEPLDNILVCLFFFFF